MQWNEEIYLITGCEQLCRMSKEMCGTLYCYLEICISIYYKFSQCICRQSRTIEPSKHLWHDLTQQKINSIEHFPRLNNDKFEIRCSYLYLQLSIRTKVSPIPSLFIEPAAGKNLDLGSRWQRCCYWVLLAWSWISLLNPAQLRVQEEQGFIAQLSIRSQLW